MAYLPCRCRAQRQVRTLQAGRQVLVADVPSVAEGKVAAQAVEAYLVEPALVLEGVFHERAHRHRCSTLLVLEMVSPYQVHVGSACSYVRRFGYPVAT